MKAADNVHEVAQYYDDNLEREKTRLTGGFYNSVEKRLVLHLIDKYFPKSGCLLDVGGGPGSYSHDFLDRGFDVTLVDISPRPRGRCSSREVVSSPPPSPSTASSEAS